MADMLSVFKDRMKQSRNLCDPHWNRSIDNYKHYLGRLDAGNADQTQYPFYSKMSVPISYEVVETVLPRVIGKDPEFTPVANEPSDVQFEPTAKIALQQSYNNPKLEVRGEPIYLKLVRAAKEQLITGNSVLRPYWRREIKKQMRYLATFERAGIRDSANIQGVLDIANKMGKTSEVFYTKKLVESPFLDDFDLKHVPFFNFFPDVSMIEAGKMRYKIEREYVTFDDIASEAVMFGYDKSVMAELLTQSTKGGHGFTGDVTKDFLIEYNNLFSRPVDNLTATDDDKIPLFILDKMWMGDRVHVFVNEKYCLTGEMGIQNPYDIMADPFIFGMDNVIPHSYFCYGEIDAIRKVEDGMTDLLNMRFDNLLQSMLNYWLVNPNFMANGDDFVPVPNSITSVKDVDKAVRMLNGSNVTGSAYQESNELYSIIQRVTGVNDYVKGSEGETIAGRTYGGMRLVQEMANARFIVKSRMYEKLTLKSLGYFMLEMSKQYVSKDRVRRMAGDAGEVDQTTLEAGKLKSILGFMDISVVPNSSMVIDQQAEAMKMDKVADRFSSGKGAFANIPQEVFDKFLYKYLLAYGVTDAIYWIRQIKDARAANPASTDAQTPQLPPAGMPQLPPTAPPQQSIPSGTIPTLQSDQISNQPNPLDMMYGAEYATPTLPGA
jgi:hypothetical protein